MLTRPFQKFDNGLGPDRREESSELIGNNVPEVEYRVVVWCQCEGGVASSWSQYEISHRGQRLFMLTLAFLTCWK